MIERGDIDMPRFASIWLLLFTCKWLVDLELPFVK